MSAITTSGASLSLTTTKRRSTRLEQAVRNDPAAFRVLTGDRPTEPLHVGRYFGTLENRVRLQELGVELLVVLPAYQTITDRDAPVGLPQDVEGLVADYLAVGIDPERAVIFTHSQVPELNQLLLPFLSLVSVAELSRNPTVKDEIAMAAGGSTSALMYTYPVHQAADILFCHANLVPVGKDQLPHVELTRTSRVASTSATAPTVHTFHTGAPQPDAAAARRRRPEDGQEPRQLDPTRRQRRRNRPPDTRRQNRT